MRVVSIYYFQQQRWRPYLRRGLLSFAMIFSAISFCVGQQPTLRDEAEIQYLAQLTLMEYEGILNLISNAGIPPEVRKEAAESAYQDPNTKIFYAADVLLLGDIAPSNADSARAPVRTVEDYFREFDENYVKSEMETVDFYNFQISNLKQEDYLYINVKYTLHFKGRHKTDPAPYKASARLAELRVAKNSGRWTTYISSIAAYDPANPIDSPKGNIALDTSVTDDGTFADKLKELVQAQVAQDWSDNDAAIEQAWIAFDNKRFKEIRNRGEQAEKSRDYAKANQYYRQALKLKPREAELEDRLANLNQRLETYRKLEDKFQAGAYVEAIKAYSEAIATDPQNADFYLGRGKSYEQLNELQTAIRDFSTAIKLDNSFVAALQNRAKLYERTAQPQQALEDYDQIIRHQPNTAIYYAERARLKKELNDLAGALEDYEAAIKLAPEVAVMHYEKGLIYQEQKQTEQAIAAFTAAIAQDKRMADAYYARGMAFADNGNISSAAVDFESARKAGLKNEQLAVIDEIAANYAAQGAQALAKEDYKQALENFIRLVLLSPADESAWVKKGDAHYQLQDYENALQSYTQAIDLENPSLAYYKRGMLYRQLKDYEAAKKDMASFVPIGWQLISKAESKASTANTNESLEQIAEEVAHGWYRLGTAQLIAEQYADAASSMDKALDINKAYSAALAARGAAQLGLKNYKKAIRDIEKSIKWGVEDTPWIYLSLGDAYEALGQTDYAISIYTYLLESVDKNFELAYLHRAESYKKLKQYQQALRDIEMALSLNKALSRDVGLITSKGLMELYVSKFQEADNSFDQALSLEDNDAWALYGKASVLASQNKMEESLELYRKAFQTGEIQWSAIKDDPIIKHVSKQKAFKELVDSSLRL